MIIEKYSQETGVQPIWGRLAKALSELKAFAERKGYVVYECDIRTFGENGVEQLHTEPGVIRLYTTVDDTKLRSGRKLVFRIHRNASDVYFIDSFEII